MSMARSLSVRCACMTTNLVGRDGNQLIAKVGGDMLDEVSLYE